MPKNYTEKVQTDIETARALLRKATAHTSTARTSINRFANGEDAEELDPVDKSNAYATVAIAECLVAALTLGFAALDEEEDG